MSCESCGYHNHPSVTRCEACGRHSASRVGNPRLDSITSKFREGTLEGVDVYVADSETFEGFERLLASSVRYEDAMLASKGYANRLFKGRPVIIG